MKNIIKYLIPCVAVALALTSCDSTMDDKAAIDSQYEKATTATASMSNVTAVDYQTISATATFTSEAEIIEEGIMVSSEGSFTKNLKFVANDTVVATFNATVAGLEEKTTYYVRAYAVTKTAGTIVSEAKTVTTPKAPIFELAGTYLAEEFEIDAKEGLQSTGSYDITIAFAENSNTEVLITNLWDAGTTLKGTYDEATHTINVPNNQLLYTHGTYGPLTILGVTEDDSETTNGVTFTFIPLGGIMKSSCFEALITTGDYAGYTLNYPTYVEMLHK